MQIRIANEPNNQDRNLLLFFLIAFGWSWLFWLPVVMWDLNLLLSVMASGPSVSAFLLTYLSEGKNGLKNLLRRAIDYKIRKVWLVPTFLLIPAITSGALLMATLTVGQTPEFGILFYQPWLIPLAFVGILFIAGPVQEEFGWRGYALDRLRRKLNNALLSSMILGVIWGFWHLPFFFIGGTGEELGPTYQQPIWNIIISTMLFSILYTWLHNNTEGSLTPALIFHTMTNLTPLVFPTSEFPTIENNNLAMYYSLILTISAAIIVTAIWGPKRLVRKLDYSH
jgi:uncharacterized protein